jgi:DNA (cytosine-5)-methyltransferase 1
MLENYIPIVIKQDKLTIMKVIDLQIPKQIELPLHLVNSSKKFTFIDLFAGIGGFRIALEKLGGQCLGYSEIDKQAIKVYQQNFINYRNQDEIELGDITKITGLPSNIDVIVGGVPCQPWSVAGCLKGFEDPRGKLWFDVILCEMANIKCLRFWFTSK